MSHAELLHAPPAAPALPRPVLTRQRGATGRLLRSELRLVFGRRRNQILLAVLGGVPLLLGVVLKVSGSPQPGEGPTFLSQVTDNGLFLVFTSLTVALPLFLPLVVGIVSADTVAGEANTGTLRYLLTVPVTRARLLAAKAAGALAYTAAAALTVAVVGLVTGAALFPLGRVTLLSGETVSLANGLLRTLGVALFVAVSLAGLAVVGLAISTLTEVPVAAMAATVGFAVVSAVLASIPQLSAIHPYLLTTHWLDFGELLRTTVRISALLPGLVTQLAYAAAAGAIAWLRFRRADVTS